MAIIRINELPEGSGNLSNDDVFIFMDSPSSGGITKKISLSELKSIINQESDVNTNISTCLLHEYADPNGFLTPTSVTIDGMSYGNGQVISDSAFGPNSSRVTLYADSMFAMVAVNADIDTVYYNGESGSDGDGDKTVSAGVSNYRGYYSYHNLISADDPAIQQIVISKSSTMSGSNRSTDTNNDDFTVTGLSGSDVVILLNLYWAEDAGPDYSSSTTVAIQQFIDLVMFDEATPRTNINNIRTAFYDNSAAIKTAIENEESDLLYDGFEFYRSFQKVTPSGGSGSDAILEIEIFNDGGTGENDMIYDDQDVLVPGTGYQVGNTLTVSGDLLGGTTPTNDVTITVNSINGDGGIISHSAVGTAVNNLWPDSYIIDGNSDQYDIGNFIGTNRTRSTALVTLEYDPIEQDGNGGYNVFPILTILSSDKTISEGQWVWFEEQNKGAFINYTLSTTGTTVTTDRLVKGDNTVILGTNGSLRLPNGSILNETNNTLSLAPPTALPGQSLVIRPTAATWSINSSGYIEYNNPITISVTLGNWAYFGTVNYIISGTGVTEQSLGRPLTGKLTFVSTTGPDTETITWTIPANSNITEFTLTLTSVDGTLSTDQEVENDPALYYDFESNAMPTGQFITVTNNNVSNSEHSHVHLVAGNPENVDIYLGDDDQYVKIEKDGGDVIIGTNNNTHNWTFGTNGSITFPDNTIQTSAGLIDSPQDGFTYSRKNGNWVDIYNPANFQLSMGTYSEVNAYIPLSGEPIYDTTNKVVYIGDGSTVRGSLISNTSKFTKLANTATFDQNETILGSCTITIANPAVFTKSNHGLKQRDRVKFSTTGSLPTGLSASTTYYVLSAGLTLNTFGLSASPNGSAIITSGSQSGTHTLTKISTTYGGIASFNSIPLTVSLNSLNSIWEITTLAQVQSSDPGNILYINLSPSINNISIENFDLIKNNNNSTQLDINAESTIEFTDSDMCYLKYHHIVQLTGSEATFGIPFEELSGIEAYLLSMSILAKRIS